MWSYLIRHTHNIRLFFVVVNHFTRILRGFIKNQESGTRGRELHLTPARLRSGYVLPTSCASR